MTTESQKQEPNQVDLTAAEHVEEAKRRLNALRNAVGQASRPGSGHRAAGAGAQHPDHKVGRDALAEEQFLGALRGLDHGLDQGDAQAAFFQFEDAIHGAARRGGDGVLQQRGMIARL